MPGHVVAQTYQGNRVVNVAVILDPTARRDPERIGALALRTADAVRLPLRELADIDPSTGRYAALHDSPHRVQVGICNVTGRDVVSFVQNAKGTSGTPVELPPELYPRIA